MTPRGRLNDLQLYVLTWVRDGCPDGTFDPDNSSHKISTRALASRGLVTIRRSGGRWNAVVTDSGRYYLEHGHYPIEESDSPARRLAKVRQPRPKPIEIGKDSPPSPRTPSPTEQLVADVVAAGGILPVAGWDERQRLEHLTAAANRFHKTPPGTRLHMVHWGGSAVRLLRLTGWDPKHEEPLDVPSALRNPQPAIVDLREQGLREVGAHQTPRALRLLNVLAKEARNRGWTVTARRRPGSDYYDREQRKGDLFITAASATVGVRVHHILRQVPVENERWRRVELVATEQLRITLYDQRNQDHASWADTDKTPVEKRLHEVLLGVSLLEAVGEVERQLRAEEERRRAERAAQETERKRLEAEERARVERLAREVHDWEYARRIRGYCADVTGRGSRGGRRIEGCE